MRFLFALLAAGSMWCFSTGAAEPASFSAAKEGAVKVLLIGGGSSHDFEKWFHQADEAILREAGYSVAYTAQVEEAVALLPQAQAIVLSTNQKEFGLAPFQEALGKFLQVGKGLVILHPGAWYNWPAETGYNARIAGGGARSHDAPGPFTVTVSQASHPIMRGVPASFEVTDELYQTTLEPAAKVEILASTSVSKKTGQTHASVWVVPQPNGRVAGIALGHDGRVHELPAFKTLLINAVQWAAAK